MSDKPTKPREGGEDDMTPAGTLFLMAVFMVALAGMWVVMYWTMLGN